MMPPRRQTGKDLPANLYPSKDARTGVVYYRWRNPATEKWHGLGTDKVRAVADAKALNAVVLADGMDRIAALGNGQVPRVAATAFAILAEQLITANA